MPFANPLFVKRQKIKKTIQFFEQILPLLELKIPLQICIRRILVLQEPKQTQVFRQMLVDLECGVSLVIAIDKIKEQFDAWGLALLKIACQSQNPSSCLKLYIQQEKIKQDIRDKILTASFYPIMLIGLSLVIFIIIQSQILPSYQQLFKQLNHPEFKTQSINLRQIIEWGLIAVISLLVPKKIRYQLPWIGPINKNLAWLTWLQLMSLSLASGSNIAQALSFTQNKILKLPMQYWHQRMIQDLQFGHFQFQFPDDLPKVCRHILNLSHLNIDLPPLFNQASLTLEQEIYAILQNLERYLQPLLLLIIAGVCAYLGMMIYSPLLDLGEFIF